MHISFKDCGYSWYTLKKYRAQVNLHTCTAMSKKLNLMRVGSLKIRLAFVATLGLIHLDPIHRQFKIIQI